MLNPVLPRYPCHDKGIEELIRKGQLTITPSPSHDQFQPASLDVRTGRVEVYRDHQRDRALRRYHQEQQRILDEAGGDIRKAYKHLVELEPEVEPHVYPAGSDALVPSGARAEITLEEQVLLAEGYILEPELRSSRGRAHLSLEGFENLGEGRYKLSVTNPNPNDIIVPGKSKFAQLFIHARSRSLPHDGEAVTDPHDIARLLPDLRERQLALASGHISFTLGKEALKFRNLDRPLRLGSFPSDDELYERVDLTRGYVLQPGEALVAQLEPAVKLPPDVGLMLLRRTPYAMERGKTSPHHDPHLTDRTQVKAGWIDPGFPGTDKPAATVTAHPYRQGLPQRLMTGQPFAYGIVYGYDTPVARPYGDGRLDSHYSGGRNLEGSRS